MNYPKPCLPADYLRSRGPSGLESLCADFNIHAKRHPVYPELVQLRYDQIASDLSNKLVQDCRGLILDEANNWQVVARPFSKFFNYGEPEAATIDWRFATVQEKLDGTLIILYHFAGKWQVATIGTPDASGEVNGAGISFAELFWRTWLERCYPLPSSINQNYTFMFELTGPLNRVIVAHDRANIKLIGVRNKASGVEIDVRYQSEYEPVQRFIISNFKDILGSFDKMDPLEQEGYVVVDAMFNRIKVKHPGYVALHHLKGGFSTRRVVEVVRKGEAAELLASFPEWQDAFRVVQASYDALIMVLQQDWENIKHLASPGAASRKIFAAKAIKTSRYPPAMFSLLDGKAPSVRDFLQEVHVDKLMELMGVDKINLVGCY